MKYDNLNNIRNISFSVIAHEFEKKRQNKNLISFNNKNSLILKLIWDRINILVFQNNNKEVILTKEDIKYNKCKKYLKILFIE